MINFYISDFFHAMLKGLVTAVTSAGIMAASGLNFPNTLCIAAAITSVDVWHSLQTQGLQRQINDSNDRIKILEEKLNKLK